MTTFITVHQEGAKDQIFMVLEDDSIKGRGWYPQRVSLNSFWRSHHFKFTGHMNFSHTYEDALAWCRGADVETIGCTSVWDFYDKIGYNHKTKKFKQ